MSNVDATAISCLSSKCFFDFIIFQFLIFSLIVNILDRHNEKLLSTRYYLNLNSSLHIITIRSAF